MLKPGILLQNRYEIMNRIGSGGMADVYKARDHKLNRFVAVKVLKQEFKDDRAFVSKFRVEAQAAAGLAHANIVNVYDVGEDRGVSFIVMELVEGITLKSYIAKKGRLSVREATSIALQVAAGLESAHNNGIIHRDVKPQNIIISMDGKAKIADFGIARAASSDTITSSAMGSVHYCAPEQTRGGYSDAKSDIYSMGITMYEMLTGRVPFDGDTTVEVALKHLQEEIPNPAQYVTEIPYAMQQIVIKCMQKSPDRRYANMGELIRDLRESLVNPEGNFVTIPKLDRKAQTVLFSKDELTRIKNSSMPTYDAGQNTGAAGKLQNERGSVSGDDRMYPYGGSYYQSSGYQDLRHNQPQDGGIKGDRYVGSVGDDYDSYDPSDDDYDDYDDEKERRRRKRNRNNNNSGSGERIVTILGILGAVVVGLLVLFFAGRAIGVIGRNTKQTEAGSSNNQQDEQTGRYVTVPDLLGKSEEEARKILKEQELGYKYQGERASSQYQKGLICEQTLAPGTSVEKNTTIGCFLSTGSAGGLTVPSLVGQSEDAAKQTLERMGLSVSFDNTRYSNDVEKGTVITTNPGAGSSVQPGDVVTVFISQGMDTSMVKVPQMVGHYVEDAKTELRNLNLYCFITEAASDTVEKDFVIAQDIEAGSMVDTGTAVTITVSTGRPGAGDITVLDGSDSTGKWICRVQLQAPPDYTGEAMLVRINLVQGDVTTTVFEGETTFPYILKAEGQPGISTGTVYLYTLDPYTWNVTSTIMYDGLNFYEEDE